jgi:hypothetical protein
MTSRPSHVAQAAEADARRLALLKKHPGLAPTNAMPPSLAPTNVPAAAPVAPVSPK